MYDYWGKGFGESNELINLYHWWVCRDDFRDFAELCFKEFGDRVKYWITLNEPSTVALNGYTFGEHAPGRCSDWLKLNCTGGDSGTEPYLVSHNLLLSHAAAANLYKTKYQVLCTLQLWAIF